MNVKWEDVKEDFARKDAEIESLKVMSAELVEALTAIKNDLLERADSDGQGMKVVDCGRSVWVQVQDALAKAKELSHAE
jgi:hypothetical protein